MLRKANPLKLAAHEFTRAYRRPPDGMTWLDIYKAVIDRRKERELAVGKQFGWLAIGTVALAASGAGSVLDIKTALLDVHVPKIYLAFLLAALVSFTLLEFLSVLLISEYQRRVGNRLRGTIHVAPGSLGAPFYYGAGWVDLFIERYTFFRYPVRIGVSTIVAIFLISAPAGLIILAAYIVAIIQVADQFVTGTPAFMGPLFGLTAMAMLTTPLVFYAIALTPFPLRKNASSVRWNFLFPIYRRSGFIPPNVASWVEKRDSSRSETK